jgi:hypothetical protein
MRSCWPGRSADGLVYRHSDSCDCRIACSNVHVGSLKVTATFITHDIMVSLMPYTYSPGVGPTLLRTVATSSTRDLYPSQRSKMGSINHSLDAIAYYGANSIPDIIVSAQGSELTTFNGTRILDWTSGQVSTDLNTSLCPMTKMLVYGRWHPC